MTGRVRAWAREHAAAFGVVCALAYLAPHLVPQLSWLIGLLGDAGLGPMLSTLVWDALVALCMLWFGRDVLALGSVRGHDGVTWGVAVVLGVGASVVGGICGTAVTLAASDGAFEAYQGSMAASPPWLTHFTALVVAPVTEELVFRAGLYGGLRRRLPCVTAGAVSAVAFALAHGTLTHMPVTIIIGLASAAMLERSGSVWPGVALHVAANAATTWVVPMLTVPAWLVSVPVASVLWVASVVGGLTFLVVCGSRRGETAG